MNADQSRGIIIMVPLYNDWPCLYKLIQDIFSSIPERIHQDLSFLIIDDCSTEDIELEKLPCKVEVLELVRNLGHQKAIAIGLSYIAKEKSAAKIIVMDVDGEDRPQDIIKLLSESDKANKRIIFAHRQKRSEGQVFKMFYRLYKWVFRILTGRSISFGNFCIIPFEQAQKLVYVSEIWNHFSGGIVRSRLPFSKMPLQKGGRFYGKSKMNFLSLVMHGLSSISVYLDVMAIRLIMFTILMMVLAFIGIIIVSGVRFFTDLAIPGWASFSVLGLTIILFQAFLIGIFVTFTILASRMRRNFIPALEYRHFIFRVHEYDR